MTYRQAEQKGEQVLQQAGIMDAKIDAWLLLEMVAHIDRGFYFMHSDTLSCYLTAETALDFRVLAIALPNDLYPTIL